MQQSIAVLICYFGKLPWYFEYYVHSCKYNPSIDFFIITDDVTYTSKLPSNVKLVLTTLEDVNKLATDKLGFKIAVKEAYKLCDFKPTFGVIFSDILHLYDFWAFGDIDVIYGDIRGFIISDLLENFDLISVRPDWIPGCFTLLKNNEKINNLFRLSKDYQKVLTSDIHYCFDETNFAHDAFTDGKSYKEIHTEIESMMHVIKKMEEVGYLKPYFDLYIIEGIPGKLKWDRGKMTYRNSYEILLYHLIRLKKHFKPKVLPKNIPDCFSISPTRIYHSG